jgi:hypothetical protein
MVHWVHYFGTKVRLSTIARVWRKRLFTAWLTENRKGVGMARDKKVFPVTNFF